MLSSYKYLVAVILGWMVAQIIKIIIDFVRHKKMSLIESLFSSGGMPSSHSALVVSVTTLIGMNEGFDSAIFGLAIAVSLVVIYDAMKVRHSVGEQAIALNKLVDKNSQLKIVKGHTLVEVIAGVILGIVVGVSVYLLTI